MYKDKSEIFKCNYKQYIQIRFEGKCEHIKTEFVEAVAHACFCCQINRESKNDFVVVACTMMHSLPPKNYYF